MLELINLNIGYSTNSHSLQKNLNIRFESGKLYALAGNNGTGKSTFLKTIAGNLLPLGGDVMVNGENISNHSPHELSKLLSVVLTEQIGGFNLTVYDVVAGGRIPYLGAFGTLQKEDKVIIDNSITIIGIDDIRNNLFEELSDGQKQKVLIAKSLAQETPIILMDEPTAFLDYESRKSLFSLLKELTEKQNKLILVSSHDLEILFKNSDKVLYFFKDSDYKFGNYKELNLNIF